MKAFKGFIAILLVLASVQSCQKNRLETLSAKEEASNIYNKVPLLVGDISSTFGNGDFYCSAPYEIALVLRQENPDGTWFWVWRVVNPDPTAIPAMTEWSMRFPSCVKPENIKSAKFAQGEGGIFVNFPVALEPNRDLVCNGFDVSNGAPVLTFNLGTIGNQPSYFAIVFDREYAVDENGVAFYKSSCNQGGTGQTCFPGIKDDCNTASCSFSQGRYFASPHAWPASTVTVGGKTYTEAEGRALWKLKGNGFSNSDARKAFFQAAAIKLSGVASSASVWADVKIIEDWLATQPKLTAASIPMIPANKAVGSAAGRIGKWIDANHCK